jgi:hypothetical protein
MDDQEPAVVICSRECLRAFAVNTSGPDRAPPVEGDASSSNKPLRR